VGRDDCFDIESRNAYCLERYCGGEGVWPLAAEAIIFRLIQLLNKGIEVAHHGASTGFEPTALRETWYSDLVIAVELVNCA
jgi:hypothetical protein